MTRHLSALPLTEDEPACVAEFGTGRASAHHGELLQGVFEDDQGTLRRGLVTVMQPDRGSEAVFRPSPGTGLVVHPPDLMKVRRAAELAIDWFAGTGHERVGGLVEVVSTVPRRIGMGSSTSDVVATMRAVAACFGEPLPETELARLAVLAEGASDSIMIDDRVVLFAHRDGFVLENFGPRLPPIVVLGCDTDLGGRGVDTLTHPAASYTREEVATFGVLRAALRRAVATGDASLLGRVATASARINQRYLPKPDLDFLLELCESECGVGVQVAHSGTVVGILFDAATPDLAEHLDRCAVRIHAAGLGVTGVFGSDATAAVRR